MNGLIAYALSKKYADEVGRSILDAGFKTQVEQDRSILQTTGQEKILYFIPKTTAKPSDGYDEYVYSNNAWEQVGATDVNMSSIIVSAKVNDNGTISFYDKDGKLLFTTTGTSVIGPQGDDYVLTAQDKADIAGIVLNELQNADTMTFPIASEVNGS